MLRTTSLSIAITVFIWSMPLGAFIDEEDQGVSCGGKRAVHMCMMHLSKEVKKALKEAKIKITNSTDNGVDIVSPGSSQNFFESISQLSFMEEGSEKLFLHTTTGHNFLFVKKIDVIPKQNLPLLS